MQVSELSNLQGVLPSQVLRSLIAEDVILSRPRLNKSQIQPASLDLRLGPVAWRVQSSFLPGPGETVAQKTRQLQMDRIELGEGAVLEKGCVYIVRLMERLALPPQVSAVANPKSSTGRLDVFTRVITNNANRFDVVPAGYSGPLYVEISPRTFSIKVRAGSRLAQLRLRLGVIPATVEELQKLALHWEKPLLYHSSVKNESEEHGSLGLAVDLRSDTSPVGWRARRHSGIIDIDQVSHHDPKDYWEAVHPRRGRVILNPDDFYLLKTLQSVVVPPEFAAEIFTYDPQVGEFRAHYAGFFDPGFGWDPDPFVTGSRAVLEVRSHDVPFALDHGQLIARLLYERMATKPDRIYGQQIGSNYQGQGLRLAKQFKRSR